MISNSTLIRKLCLSQLKLLYKSLKVKTSTSSLTMAISSKSLTLLKSLKLVWLTNSQRPAVISYSSRDNSIRCMKFVTDQFGNMNSSLSMLKDAISNGFSKQTRTTCKRSTTSIISTRWLITVVSKAKYLK